MKPGHTFAEGQRVRSVDGRSFGFVTRYAGIDHGQATYEVQWTRLSDGTPLDLTTIVHEGRLTVDQQPTTYGPTKRIALL